jgi:hypothetical protein
MATGGSGEAAPRWMVARTAGGAPSGVKARADGFTPDKRRRFLAALEKTGCWRDAARAAPISGTTARRWRARDADFAAQCDVMRGRAAPALETIAWNRATVGAEQKVYRKGELVEVRVKPSDAMLRLLLQATNPKKFGAVDAAAREQIAEALRAEIEKELRPQVEAELRPRIEAELRAAGRGPISVAEGNRLREELMQRLSDFNRRMGGEG